MPYHNEPIKRTFKDSVFTHMFAKPEFLLLLYQELHPEDTDVTVDDLATVTIQNVLVDAPYNDLGFTVGDRLVVLVEAQSTWSPNVAIRAFLYMAQTLKDWIRTNSVNLYSGTAAHLPKPELYVVYTGTRKNVPTEISLERDIFGDGSGIEVEVKVLRGGGTGIVSQYVEFARIGNEAVRKYGPTREAAAATVDECVRRGILVDYLVARRGEVEDIMFTLFDEEEVLRCYYKELEETATRVGMEKGMKQGMEQGLEKGMEQGLEQGLEQGMKQGMEQGMEQGLEQGLEKGKLQMLGELVRDGVLSVSDAAERAGLSVQEFNARIADL